jgi:hypothetical protein
LTPLLASTWVFDITEREGSSSRYKIIYVKNK